MLTELTQDAKLFKYSTFRTGVMKRELEREEIYKQRKTGVIDPDM